MDHAKSSWAAWLAGSDHRFLSDVERSNHMSIYNLLAVYVCVYIYKHTKRMVYYLIQTAIQLVINHVYTYNHTYSVNVNPW